jgi:hypothetical protein
MDREGLPEMERNAIAGRHAAPRFLAAPVFLVLAFSLALSGPVLAAGFKCEQPAEVVKQDTLDELDEIVVTGEKVTTRARALKEWLRLLEGKFTYEGYVDLCGQGNRTDQRPVRGDADCVGSGDNPNVLCTVNVRWPDARGEDGEPVLGGASTLRPAYVIYSLENRYEPEKQTYHLGLMFTQVDNKGIAEWASGTLVGDTFTSSEPCVGIPGACRKITKITARPESKEIYTQVDVEIDNQRVLHQSFVLRRQSKSADGKRTTGSPP